MMVWLLFIIGHMGLFFYNKIGSIISIGDLPTINIIESNIKSEQNQLSDTQNSVFVRFLYNISILKFYNKEFLKSKSFYLSLGDLGL